MLTLEDMKYYIDPIATPYEDTKKVFVHQVRYERHHTLVGQIVNVKGAGDIENHRMWFATDGGNFVYGPAAGCQSVGRYKMVLARMGDVFICGETLAVRRTQKHVRLLNSTRMSNGKTLGGISVPVTDWIEAADWAWECMPADGDSEDVITAKLALAKQKWETRNAKIEIMRQGLNRGWTQDLKALQEEGTLFKGLYGARITGTAMTAVPISNVTLDGAYQTVVDEMTKADVVTRPQQTSAYVGVPVAFYAQLEARTYEEATAPNQSVLNSYLHSKPGMSRATMGPAAASPILVGTY